jgi:hypothetical protein
VPSLDLVVARQAGGSDAWDYEEFLRLACAAVRDETVGNAEQDAQAPRVEVGSLISTGLPLRLCAPGICPLLPEALDPD